MASEVADVAQQIRQALKERFPGVKFSVRSDNYSMGSSINIRWTDGPTSQQVEAIAKGGESVRYDAYGEILSGGNRFVFCNRDISPEFERKALAEARQRYGIREVVAADLLDHDDRISYHRVVSEMEGDTPKAPAKPAKETPKQDKPQPVEAQATYSITGAWSWLKFGCKPATEVLQALHNDGWRWSKKREAWYNLDGKQPPQNVPYLTA